MNIYENINLLQTRWKVQSSKYAMVDILQVSGSDY